MASGVVFQKSKLLEVACVLFCIFFSNALTNASLNVLIYLETVLSFTIAAIGVIFQLICHISTCFNTLNVDNKVSLSFVVITNIRA